MEHELLAQFQVYLEKQQVKREDKKTDHEIQYKRSGCLMGGGGGMGKPWCTCGGQRTACMNPFSSFHHIGAWD